MHEGAEFEAVEADHREVGGHGAAEPAGGAQGADGDDVVEGEHRGEVRVRVQQRFERRRAAVGGLGGARDGTGVEAVRGGRGGEPLTADAGLGAPGVVEHPDPLVARGDEVRDRLGDAV